MPDHKRVNGPEVTIPYQLFFDANNQTKENPENYLKRRADGRAFNETRKMFAKTGIVSQAKGSAYIELGKTKLVCSVFDPREIPNKTSYSQQGSLYCEFKYAPFSCEKRRIHQQDAEEKEYSLIMQRSLEPAVCRHEFPNFQVDIYVLVLDNGGSCLGAAITAASLALANASISMFGLVTAVTAGVFADTVFLDPTIEEELLCNTFPSASYKSENHGIIVQASLPQHSQISELYFVGNIDFNLIKSTMDILLSTSNDLCLVMQQCLVKSVIKTLKEKEKEKEDK
ncbi:exosome complex component MTR3-like [Chelonus insularis]|uniref:exosome complex component MTR3-like n=1 Tax=Chelonus insularis TaxID=460826 RepID=UPI00158B216F|nr:exosome complex component MTR3-like [Chelonus insularis]